MTSNSKLRGKYAIVKKAASATCQSGIGKNQDGS